jgi:hypothetical protein
MQLNFDQIMCRDSGVGKTLFMDANAMPQPQEHLDARLAAGPIKVDDQRQLDHSSFITRLNAKIGLKVTTVIGTMWAAYLFTMIALVGLPGVIQKGDIVTIVIWLSSSLLQLVLLPIIIVGQNIQAKAADARSEATYNDAAAILQQAIEIQAHLVNQDKQLASQEATLSKMIDSLSHVEEKLAKSTS